MRTVLCPEARDTLDDLARRRALLVFDFDGTLAPIVPDREAAQMRPETRRLLRAVTLFYPCAVLSGRGRGDVAARLDGVPFLAVVGNHGAETGHGPLDRTRRAQVLGWVRDLRDALHLVPGLDIEDKWFSVAIHYRHVPGRAAARRLAIHAAAKLDGAPRVFGGHAVVNVLPGDAPHKGAVIEELLRRAGRRPVLYLGDDRTDEDAFRSPLVDVGIRVGRTARSAARWYVPHQPSVDDLLRALLAACTRRDGRGDRCEGLVRAVGS